MNTIGKNVILIDADYVDQVAFRLTVNFERMIGRRIPKADLAQWLVCVALDGRLREGDNTVEVAMIHDKERTAMDNFVPADYEHEINGQAFRDERLGEFVLAAYPVEPMVSKTEFMADALQTVCGQKGVERVVVVANMEDETVRNSMVRALRDVDDEQVHVTMLTMQPLTAGGPFRQELLGYSLMAALGIRSEELSNNSEINP